MSNVETRDTAGVAVRPPLLFLSGLLVGWLLEFALPLGPVIGFTGTPRWIVGLVLVALAFAFFIPAARGFSGAGTSIPTDRPTTALVTSGPYRWTRNPIYLALMLLYLGIAVLGGLWWAVPLLIPILLVLHFGVVLREEAYLERKFGDAYRAYRTEVRRYL
jgi:protein-S-isoprenylcysteine O-methyltransferase Ste14